MAGLGIDFGTTNSLMVAYDREKNMFHYFSGAFDNPSPISSTIMYHDNQVIIGKAARERMYKFEGVEGYHFEKSIKLKLGTTQYSDIFGDNTEPYKIAGKIIEYLKNKAENEYSASKKDVDLNRAVFTVPINFSGKARRDLRKAANEAGIEVISFIHEPFAAIIGYFFANNDNKGSFLNSLFKRETCSDVIKRLKEFDNQYILTFDWGGGTLDITVVHVVDGKMYELGTSELTNKAGDKFDELLASYVWHNFCERLSNQYSNEFLEKKRKLVWGRLLAQAEMCKIELSTFENTVFSCEYVLGDDLKVHLTEEINRADFESKVINEILDSAVNKIDEAIEQAAINPNQISHVLLTGGTCFIPAVQNRMIKKFGHRVESVKDADLLIAQGAAVISELGWVPFLTKDILIEMSDNSYWAIFEHGRPIVASEEITNEEEFVCVDQRRKNAKVIFREGMYQEAGKVLAILNVPTLGNNYFGDDIHVKGTIDRDIVLKVSAYSRMVHGYKQLKIDGVDEEYSIRKTAEVYKLCFGLDIKE